MIPFNLTSTPAELDCLKHEASTPGDSYYHDAAAALVEALDRGDVDTAMGCVEDVVAELNDLCGVHDMPSTIQKALRDLADRLEESAVEPPGGPDE